MRRLRPPLFPLSLPATVKVDYLPFDRTLEGMLEAGELDALFALYIPSIFQNGSPRIARLFPNSYEVEQDYYYRTRIFPICAAWWFGRISTGNPSVTGSIYKAFCVARDPAVTELYDTDALRLSLPWLISHLEETWWVLAKDFWAYGLEPNRAAFEAIGQYVYEQGFSPRAVSPEELFAPDV